MPITFDAARQRYVANGKTVAPRAVRTLIESDLSGSRQRMQAIGRQFQAGELTTLQFRKQIGEQIASIHTAHYAAGAGGWDNMTPQKWGAVGQRVKVQRQFLNGLIKRCEDPDYLKSDQMIRHLGQYADAGVGVFEAARRDSMVGAGYTECRNIEDAEAHHCRTSNGVESCPQQTAKGWVSVEAMVAVGERACGQACRCELEYRRPTDNP
jgi:hypothetical protein